MTDDILKNILNKAFKNKRELRKYEFRGNLRFFGNHIIDQIVKDSKKKNLIKTRQHGSRYELNFDLFK